MKNGANFELLCLEPKFLCENVKMISYNYKTWIFSLLYPNPLWHIQTIEIKPTNLNKSSKRN